MRRLARPAARVGFRRPAAAGKAAADPGRRVRRRPAAEEEQAEGGEAVELSPEEVFRRFQGGELVPGHRIGPGQIAKGDWVLFPEATYYQKKAPCAIRPFVES